MQPVSFGPPIEWKQSSGTGVCPTVCANAGVAAMLCTTGATHAVATPVNAARRRNDAAIERLRILLGEILLRHAVHPFLSQRSR